MMAWQVSRAVKSNLQSSAAAPADLELAIERCFQLIFVAIRAPQ
jgi:hypothetical protein